MVRQVCLVSPRPCDIGLMSCRSYVRRYYVTAFPSISNKNNHRFIVLVYWSNTFSVRGLCTLHRSLDSMQSPDFYAILASRRVQRQVKKSRKIFVLNLCTFVTKENQFHWKMHSRSSPILHIDKFPMKRNFLGAYISKKILLSCIYDFLEMHTKLDFLESYNS